MSMHGQIHGAVPCSWPVVESVRRPRRPTACEALPPSTQDRLLRLLALAGYPSPAMGHQQQREKPHREADAPGQRLDGARAGASIPQEKEQPGKQAVHHANQQDNDDELEHERFR